MSEQSQVVAARRIRHTTAGQRHGPITRLMSPGDLGQAVKPFVFLDLFSAERSFLGGMGIHPHSGIATVTVLTEGDFRFDDPVSGTGSIGYGGVEWMRAAGGVWHGKELSPGEAARVTGYQLWLALPAELENGPVDSQYLEASAMPSVGPAIVILGEYGGRTSPVRSPAGVTYLMVTLQSRETWVFDPASDHDVAWLSVSHGSLVGDHAVNSGELAILEGTGSLSLQAGFSGARFVIGSAVEHPHDLVTGSHSVHTNRSALALGEARIAQLHKALPKRQPDGAVPVIQG